MKRIHLALLALGFTSLNAFAALPATSDPTLVSVPQLPRLFEIGVTASNLQPSPTHGDLDYANLNTGTGPFNSALQSGHPNYEWSYGVNLGYIFNNTSNDIRLMLSRLETNDHDDVLGPEHSIDPVNFEISLPEIAGFDFAKTRSEYDIDQADLTLGQFMNVGCRLNLHAFSGVRYTKINRELDSTYIQPVTGHDDKLLVDEDSDFDGAGPIAGLDASYYLGLGFGAVGHFDSALLLGSIDSDTLSNIAAGVPVRFIHNFHYESDSKQRIVPATDAKLGLDYTYLFRNTSLSNLTLEVGYQVSSYFNAVDRLAGRTVFLPRGIIPQQGITAHKTSDVGLNGPYVNLTLYL